MQFQKNIGWKDELEELNKRFPMDTEILDARFRDAFVLRFLIAKKFDVDNSFQMVNFQFFHKLYLIIT